MEFSIKSGNPEKQRCGCVIVGVFDRRRLSLPAELIDNASGGFLSEILRRGDMDGKSASTLLLHRVPGTLCDRVLLVGLGKEKEFREKDYRAAVRAAIKALSNTNCQDASFFLSEIPLRKRELTWRIRNAVSTILEAAYRFEQFKRLDDETKPGLRKITLMVERRNELAQAELGLRQGHSIGTGMTLTRDLGNLPPNICHPSYLADQAKALAEELQLECEILERSDMEALGMNALLAVARGAQQPPKLIVLHYRGGDASSTAPIVLVGKGVTFDTGGISLKPAAEMDEMKYDMCGAAAVLGTISAIARMALPINLTVIVPATENMPDGNATRPGDIVKTMKGDTVEILNTDAEGRLILCDALTYAERFKPDTLIDVATLTGACVVALGHVASGLFANNEALARDLLDAGEETGDRAWHMPLWDDYQELLKSPFADMANIGGRWGGAITAACFLSRFTKKTDWAHLDIAGTAWKSGTDKGATGRPVALLTHYLMQRAGQID